MKFWEAMKAMEEGKKIKRPGVYLLQGLYT
jgi:hypothetical protein